MLAGMFYRTRRPWCIRVPAPAAKMKPGLKNIRRKQNEKIDRVRGDGFNHCRSIG
jgi:hypothetical protein